MDKIYDVITLGAGPSGLAAGIYVRRMCLDTLLIEKGEDDGQIAITDETENYPGRMADGGSGPSLIEGMARQVEESGVKRVCNTVVSVDIEGPIRTLIGSDGTYKARTLITTTGAFPRPIGCKGEGEFIGKGVSYCATYDTSFFEDLEIFVVGGGGSAVEEAVYLIKFAKKVTVIHRRDELRAARSTQEHAFRNPKLFSMWDMVVEELHRDDILSGMTARDVKTGELTRIDADEDGGLFGVFGFIGYNPRGELFEGKLEMDRGYIRTDEDMRANMEDVYAVGDIRVKSSGQVVTATADGAIASMQVEKWLAEQK